MNHGRTGIAVAGVLTALLAAGCGGQAIYVHAGDPVLRICQSAAVQNIAGLQQSVDDANNTDGGLNAGTGQAMVAGQVSDLQHAAASYRTQAATVAAAHPGFAAALESEAQEFGVAASAADGLTTNSVAIAVNKFSGQIQGDCTAFQVGTAPQAGRPGPGIWNWGLFWLVTGGYALMTLIAGFLIALAQRDKPRKNRLTPGKIFWLSTVWWVTIFTAIGGTYRHALASLTLTRDEKKDDRLAALAKENARLEAELEKPLP